jgi:hypothetical protein
MNQKQFDIQIGKAEKEFTDIVGGCFLFLKANTDVSDLEIIAGLQTSLAQVIEEIRESAE